jgi:hypothetical protein
MEYYSAIKKDEIRYFAGKCMELEIITLREISQTDKTNIACSLSYAETRPKKKLHKNKMGETLWRWEVVGR